MMLLLTELGQELGLIGIAQRCRLGVALEGNSLLTRDRHADLDALLKFLNSDLVLRWAEVTLGLQSERLSCKPLRIPCLPSPPLKVLPNFTAGVVDPLAHHAALLESGIGTSRPFTGQQNWGFADSRGEP